MENDFMNICAVEKQKDSLGGSLYTLENGLSSVSTFLSLTIGEINLIKAGIHLKTTFIIEDQTLYLRDKTM